MDDGPDPTRRAAFGPETRPEADPEAVARAICLRLLTQAPRTRSQLAEALRRRNVPDPVAEDVLGRFSDVGLIDDTAFASAWVESRHAGRGLARRALAHELRHRGVGESDVEAALERLDPEQEATTARLLVERRLRATRHLEHQVRLRRLTGMLIRKGYPPGLAFRAVQDVLDAADDEPAAVDDWGNDVSAWDS